MSYQRFSFEALDPERQRQILEKHRRQQEQREMLLQQMEEKARLKHGIDPASLSAPPLSKTQPVPTSATIDSPFRAEFVIQQPFPGMSMTARPQRTLLIERPRKSQPELSMTMNMGASRIRDTFANLRSNMIAPDVRRAVPVSPRQPNLTFGSL